MLSTFERIPNSIKIATTTTTTQRGNCHHQHQHRHHHHQPTSNDPSCHQAANEKIYDGPKTKPRKVIIRRFKQPIMTEEDIINEPTAPMVKIGQRVAYKEYYGNEFGTIRWIGRVPQICPDWTVGVEFDNAIGEGDGSLNGRRYFVAKDCFAKFLPLTAVVQVDQHIGRPEPGTMISVMSAAVRPGQMISIQRVSTVHVQHCFLNAPHRRIGHDILAVNNRLHCQCPSCGPCAHVVKPSKSQRLGRAGKNATHMCQFSTYTCCGMESQEDAICSYSNEPPPPPKLPPIGNSWMEGSGYLTTLQEQQSKFLPNEFKLMAAGSLDRKHSKRRHHHHHHRHGHHHRHHRNKHSPIEITDGGDDNSRCGSSRSNEEKTQHQQQQKQQFNNNNNNNNNDHLSTQSLTYGQTDKLPTKNIDEDQRSYYHEDHIMSTNHQPLGSTNITTNNKNSTNVLNSYDSNYNHLNHNAINSNGVNNEMNDDQDKKEIPKPGQTIYRTSIDNRYLYPTDNYYGEERGADSEIDSDYRSEHRNSSRFSDKSRNIIRSLKSLVSCLTPSTSSNTSKRSNQRQFSDATISYTQSEPKLTQSAPTNDHHQGHQCDADLSSQQMISQSNKDLKVSQKSPLPVPSGYEDNDSKLETILHKSRGETDESSYILTPKENSIDANQDKQNYDFYGKMAERVLCTAALTQEETDRLNIQLKKAEGALHEDNYDSMNNNMFNPPQELNKFMARIIRRAANDIEFSKKILSLENRRSSSHQSTVNSSNTDHNNNESFHSRTPPKLVDFDYHKTAHYGDNETQSYGNGQSTSKSLPRNFINQSTTSGSMSISSRESCTSGTSLTGDIMAHLNDATINIPVIAPSVPQAFQLNLTLSINSDPSLNRVRIDQMSNDANHHTRIETKNLGNVGKDSQPKSNSSVTSSPPRYNSTECTSSSASLINITLNSNAPTSVSNENSSRQEKIDNEEQKDKSESSSPSIAFNENTPIYATIVRANKRVRPNNLNSDKLEDASRDSPSTNKGNEAEKSKGSSENKANGIEILQEKSKLPNGNISNQSRNCILEKRTDSREVNDSGCENTGIL